MRQQNQDEGWTEKDQQQEPEPKGEGPMSEREKPQPRVQRVEGGSGATSTKVEFPFVHDDGWNEVTVGWHEEDGCWIAHCSAQGGAYGHSETSQLHALAELVRSLGALCSMFAERETELHRAIYNSPDALAKELRDAESDLHEVQQFVCNEVENSDKWNAGLRPLWRAEAAITAFAARIASRAEPALAVDPSWSTPNTEPAP